MAWAPNYITSNDLKGYVDIPALDTEDDAEIAWAIAAASRAVDNYCNRQFGSAAGARLYTPRWSSHYLRYVLDVDDLMSLAGASLEVDGEAVAVADCVFVPLNAVPDGLPWTMCLLPTALSVTGDEGSAEFTATWGWTAVPETVEQATVLQASRFLKRKDSPLGVAGSPEMGNEMRLLAKADPDVCVMLKHFQRVWVSA